MNKYKADAALFLGLAGFSMGLYSLLWSNDEESSSLEENKIEIPDETPQNSPKKLRRHSSLGVSDSPRESIDDLSRVSRKRSQNLKRGTTTDRLNKDFKIVKMSNTMRVRDDRAYVQDTDNRPLLLVSDSFEFPDNTQPTVAYRISRPHFTLTREIPRIHEESAPKKRHFLHDDDDLDTEFSSLCEIVSEHVVISKDDMTELSITDFEGHDVTDARIDVGGDEIFSSEEDVELVHTHVKLPTPTDADVEGMQKLPRCSGGDIMHDSQCSIVQGECDEDYAFITKYDQDILVGDTPRTRLKKKIEQTPTENLALDDFIFE